MIRTLHGLPVSQKLALIGVFFMIPDSIMLYLFVTTINANIGVARLEQVGDEYQRPLARLLDLVPRHRILTREALVGDADARAELPGVAARIDAAFDALVAVDAHLGGRLAFTPDGLARRNRQGCDAQSVRREWDRLTGQMDGISPSERDACDRRHLKLIADLRTMIAHAGDNSNLILDPDIDSYYLMDVTLLALPQTQDRLAQVMADGTDLLRADAGGRAAADLRIRLAVGLAQLRADDLDRIVASTDVSLTDNLQGGEMGGVSAPFQARVPPAAAVYAGAARHFDDLAAAIEAGPRGRVTAAEFLSAGTAARDASLAYWTVAVDQLDTLLQNRIDTYTWRRTRSLGVAGCAVLAAVALVTFITRSITAPLRHTSLHDTLTGLPNRLLFAERVERCLALGRRSGYDFAVMVLDLDRFKIINDSLGHAAGDKVLTTVADRIAATLRPADVVAVADGSRAADRHTVARMGGDEFTILLENLRTPQDAARVAERVRMAVAQAIGYQGHELTTTASIGIVACGAGGQAARYDTAKDLLRDADAAMYKAKAAGKDRYAVFDPAMHAEVVQRMTLEADLRRAVDRGELELEYQPIVTLAASGRAGSTVGLEALVRWRRDGKRVSPADFIPVAEDTGMIVPIGTWVLREACRQMARWRAVADDVDDVYVTVNVSRRQLADPDLLATVQAALSETGLPPSALGLEITEGAVMQDAAAAERTLLELKRDVGVRLLMDDFGTGHSSLACLHRFPIDVLKVDRAFVQNVAADRRDAAFMEAIITLPHRLGMTVVAEGVESAPQAAFLSAAGCDLAQGFLFSRPLSAAAAEQFVRDRGLRAAA